MTRDGLQQRMAKANALRRQVWQARNLGVRHVAKKIKRRLMGPAPQPSPSSTARIEASVLGWTPESASSYGQRCTRLEEAMRTAFDAGRYLEYLNCGRELGQFRDDHARHLGLDPSHRRIIGSGFLGPLGHLSFLDIYEKLAVVGQSGGEDVIVSAERERIPNNAYLDLWKRHFVIEDITAQQWVDLHHVFEPITERADFMRTESGYEPSMFLWDRLNRRWELEGRQPLLELPTDLVERGSAAIERMGVPRGAWYVCFHVREGDHRVSYRGPNARVETYVDAMAEVVRRGGYAIRMGDADMTPLPNMPGVIDYAHAVQRADWLDVYLWATCRFFVGTGSGPVHVPGTFGVPVLMTNTSAVGMFVPYSTGAMMITKHMMEMDTGRELNIGEALQRGAGWNWSADFSRHGVRLEDNSASEIRDAVVDMFDAVEGRAPTPTVGQINFDELRRCAGSAITTPCAPSFAERFV